MSAVEAVCVWDVAAELGEGPVWSARESALWFVDIKGLRIHRYEAATGARRSWETPDQTGFLAPIAGGGFVAGLKSGLHRFDPDRGSFDFIARVDPPELDNRLNDGFVDPEGRLWFGSMHDPEVEPSGALHRLDAGPRVTKVDAGYCITNGPAMSPDGRTLYHVDTLKRVIYAFPVEADGALGERREFVSIARPGAYPDGPAVDAEGCVWISLFGGWGIERYAPDGRLIGRVEAPCANITKAAFGGDDLRTLYFTSAWKGLSADERRAQPMAGGLFSVRVDTPGLLQNDVRQGL